MNTLEVGDFIPFLSLKCEGKIKNIHSFCNEKPFLFLTIKNINSFNMDILNHYIDFNIIFVYQEGSILNKKHNVYYTKDMQLQKILNIDEILNIYITNANRRIVSILHDKNINKLDVKNKFNVPQEVHIPYLLIENALDPSLLQKVIQYYNTQKNEGNLISHKTSSKDRFHVHPDINLEKAIDNKLSRSVLPELKKVFYFDVQYRETYKICSYDSESSGRFHPHRDTPAPHQHRKYAMSLFLNDDYEGGKFMLSEYGLKIKPKANTAFVFPGISTHQVLPVTKGSRMTIITFFVTDTSKPHYKMKSHFFREKNIIESDIYPV